MRINGATGSEESVVDDEMHLAEREAALEMARRNSSRSHGRRGTSARRGTALSAVNEAKVNEMYPALTPGRTYLARFHRQVREGDDCRRDRGGRNGTRQWQAGGGRRPRQRVITAHSPRTRVPLRQQQQHAKKNELSPVSRPVRQTTHVNELSFREGDRMQVLEGGCTGPWVLVHGLDCNETGVVPYEALQEVSRQRGLTTVVYLGGLGLSLVLLARSPPLVTAP